MTLVTLGRIDLAMQDVPAAAGRFDESYRLASSAGEMLGIAIAQHHRGWPKLFSGDVDGAEEDFAESLDTSIAMHHDEGIAYGLEGLAGVRAAQGDAAQAGLLRRGRADPASAHGLAEPGEPQPVRSARGRAARERWVGDAGCRDRGGRRAAGRGGGGACHPLIPLGAAS